MHVRQLSSCCSIFRFLCSVEQYMYIIVILSFSIIHCGFRSSLICDFSLPFVVFFSIFLKQYFKISSDTLHDNFVDDFIKLQCIISNTPHRPSGGVLVAHCCSFLCCGFCFARLCSVSCVHCSQCFWIVHS